MAEYEAAGKILEDARHEAAKLVLAMREGTDPKARRGAAANTTLRQALGRYLEGPELSDRSKKLYRRWIEDWLDEWLDRPLREITSEMVMARFRTIKAKVARRTKTANFASEPGAATANAVIKTFRTVWNCAEDDVPDLPPNPVKLRKRWYKVPERERFVPGDHLPKFYQAVMALCSTTMRDYILLVLFTGLRREEAAGLRWSDIDFSQRIIRLSGKRTKAKRKLDLPMSDFMHDLLVARRAIGVEGDYVFPGNSKSRHLQEPKAALHDVGKRCGVQVSVHDLRRTFVTHASLCPIPPMALSGLVNHSPGSGTTAGYARISGADLADAMQIVTNRLKQLCQVPEVLGAVPLRA